MVNLNNVYGEEFNKLKTEADEASKEFAASVLNMQQIPEITNLEVCQQLEHAHFCIYINAIRMSNVAMRLSQLYHYTYMINQAFTEDNKS